MPDNWGTACHVFPSTCWILTSCKYQFISGWLYWPLTFSRQSGESVAGVGFPSACHISSSFDHLFESLLLHWPLALFWADQLYASLRRESRTSAAKCQLHMAICSRFSNLIDPRTFWVSLLVLWRLGSHRNPPNINSYVATFESYQHNLHSGTFLSAPVLSWMTRAVLTCPKQIWTSWVSPFESYLIKD